MIVPWRKHKMHFPVSVNDYQLAETVMVTECEVLGNEFEKCKTQIII